MDFQSCQVRPPYDPSMVDIVNQTPFNRPTDTLKQTIVDLLRQRSGLARKHLIQQIHADPKLDFREKSIPGLNSPIMVEIITSKGSQSKSRPGIVFFHGGGMVSGDRLLGADMDWVKHLDAVVVTVDYHLAPENKGESLVEDCFAGLTWVGENLEELCIDANRLIVAGASAGAGLAASTVLVSRDRGGPKLCAQLLMCPMLDDRNNNVSSMQFWDSGTYTAAQNDFNWSCVLDDRLGAENVSYRVAAGRARVEDLTGLPEAYIDVGSAEPFRDEAVAYASKLWEAGTQAELHVWPGGPHGFELWKPEAEISRTSKLARDAWLEKVLRTSTTHLEKGPAKKFSE